MIETLIQQAKIVALDGDKITCTIECVEACAGCSAKAMCGKNENKIIELINTGAERHVGDVIEIEVDTKTGFLAIAIAYLIPIAIIIVALITTRAIGVSELWQGVVSIVSVVLYYIIIKIFGIGRSISITIVE